MRQDGPLSKIGLVVPSDSVRQENRQAIEAMAELKCASVNCEALH